MFLKPIENAVFSIVSTRETQKIFFSGEIWILFPFSFKIKAVSTKFQNLDTTSSFKTLKFHEITWFENSLNRSGERFWLKIMNVWECGSWIMMFNPNFVLGFHNTTEDMIFESIIKSQRVRWKVPASNSISSVKKMISIT